MVGGVLHKELFDYGIDVDEVLAVSNWFDIFVTF